SPALEQQRGQDPRAGTHVSDDRAWGQSALRLQQLQRGRRITGSIFDVVLDAAREPLGGSEHTHAVGHTGKSARYHVYRSCGDTVRAASASVYLRPRQQMVVQ